MARPILPPHAYVPGQTARHPEDFFDPIKARLHPGMDAAAPARSDAWRGGWTCFNAGFYWEAHELFEPVWMALPEGPEREFVQGAIQLANAALKARMDRPRAVVRLCDMAEGHFTASGRKGDSVMGVPLAEAWAAVAVVRGGGRQKSQNLYYNAQKQN